MADQLLWRTAIGFTAFLRFLTDMRCCENSKCVIKNGNLEQLWISVCRKNMELWKTWKYKNLTIRNSKFRIIHRAIKSVGSRYTISLLVNYTGNLELRSFYCSMLHPNNACRKHLILSFYQRKKKKAMVTCKRSDAVVKKLTSYEHLALSKTKKETQVASGLH